MGDDAGNEVIVFQKKTELIPLTTLDELNIWWLGFKSVAEDMKMDLTNMIFPASTDNAYMRVLGIPVIGFSHINNSPILFHDNHEFNSAANFLKGITFYEKLIQKLANLEPKKKLFYR